MSSTEEYSSLDTKSVQEFFARFYQISDTPGIDDEYPKQFTEDATFILGSKRSDGHAGTVHGVLPRTRGTSLANECGTEIRKTRGGMWETVKSRKHEYSELYGKDTRSIMLHGHVTYVLKTGEERGIDWAARATLAWSEADKTWKFSYYQVYL